MDSNTYDRLDSILVDVALCDVFLGEFLDSEKGIHRSPKENLNRWCIFINEKNLGIHVSQTPPDSVGHADWLYTVTDSKKWFLTQIKYSLNFRNPDESKF
jgi:hypothetical protein